jgi:glyoxylase-like metal-dependent hydrolase (beta-lactamase superfamily II)
MAKETHRFNIGEIACMVVSDSTGPMPAERPFRLFPNVPPDDLNAAMDRSGQESISLNCLLIETDGQRILVDTGMGANTRPNSGHLLDNLSAEGIAPEDIDMVVITHCHGDHINGLTDDAGRLTFPNADYIMAIDEWNHRMSDEALASISAEQAAQLRSKLDPIKDRLTLVDAGAEIAPGITTQALYGHTPGHTGLEITSGGESLLAIVDTAHMLAQFQHPEWSPMFDAQPDVSADTRRALFERAAQTGVLLLVYHFPFPGLGHVAKVDDMFDWQPVQ